MPTRPMMAEMGDPGGTTREAEDIGLAGQIDALLAGMTEAAAGLAAEHASDQVRGAPASTLSGTAGEPDEAALEPAAEEAPDGVAGKAGTPGATASGPGDRGSAASADPLRPEEVQSLATQIDALVQEVTQAAEPTAPDSGPTPEAEGPASQQAGATDPSGDAAASAGAAPSAGPGEAAADDRSTTEAAPEAGALTGGEPDAAARDAAVDDAAPSQVEPDASSPADGAPDAGVLEPVESAGSDAQTPTGSVGAAAEPRQDLEASDAESVGARDAGEPEHSSGDVGEASVQTEPVEASSLDLSDLDRQLADLAPVVPDEGGLVMTPSGTALPSGASAGLAAAKAGPAKGGGRDEGGEAGGQLSSEVAPAGHSLALRARRLGASALPLALHGVRAVAGASARAMDRAPKVVKDTVGWVGLVTVFFACCMWAVVLFFRSTPTPEVYGAVPDVLEPHEPTPQPRPRPHAQEHGAEDSHAKEEEHAAPAGDHGGGGGH